MPSMDLSERIEGFARLGDYLKDSLTGDGSFAPPELHTLAREAEVQNPWFTPAFIHHALKEISVMLDASLMEEWLSRYDTDKLSPAEPKTIGTILAGNIPAVGFHDFLCILLSGHKFKGKLSGKDDKLLPFLAEKLKELEPGFSGLIAFKEKKIGGIDAMIATGSNNSSRYFEYYFGKYPHIFRKNRNGVALLDGGESREELSSLADDIFLYFGMGCRSISKIYVPAGHKFDALYEQCEPYSHLRDHNKYANNYQYQRSVFLMNQVPHLDNGFLIIRPDPKIASAVATLH